MLENNIINSIHYKIDEINQLKDKISQINQWFFPTIGFILWIYMTVDFLTSSLPRDEVSGLVIFFTIFIMIVTTLFTLLEIGLIFFLPLVIRLEKKEKQFIEYLSQENVQIEIINFKKLEFVNTDSINELKKYFALKEYRNAYELLSKILYSISEIEKQKVSTVKINKLINDYELNLKMKL